MGLYELEEGVWGKTEISLLDYSKAFRMAYVESAESEWTCTYKNELVANVKVPQGNLSVSRPHKFTQSANSRIP